MAYGVPKHVIEQIRAANDIVDIVQSYVPLKRSGSNFKALSPFQKEKTPSFMVSPTKQIFKCFSSGKGGDVFGFIQEMEGVEFPEALHILAERAGIEIETGPMEGGGKKVDKKALFGALEDFAHYYRTVLKEDREAESARTYLADRDLEGKAAEEFQIGYAPAKREVFYRWARKKGYSDEMLEQTGMIGRDGQRVFERFSGRVMFPIRDELGRVVGFSGRILDPDAHPAKYLNTPDTLLFKKSRILYGLDRARRAMAEERRAILCEGQIDVIRCHLAGFPQVVAPQGTALTEEHVRLIKRYADTVYVMYDSDEAGMKAALRSAELFLTGELNLRIASLPEGEDPDSLIQGRGADALRDVLNAAQSPVRFLLGRQLRSDGQNTDIHMHRAAQAAIELIGHSASAVQRDLLLREAARELGVSEAALKRDLERTLRPRSSARREEETAVAPKPHCAEEVALIELLVDHPDLVAEASRYLRPVDLVDADCRAVYNRLLEGVTEPSTLLDALADCPGGKQLVVDAQMANRLHVANDDYTQEDILHHIVMKIRRRELLKKRQSLQNQCARAEGAEKDRLDLACRELTIDLHRLRQDWKLAQPILEVLTEHAAVE